MTAAPAANAPRFQNLEFVDPPGQGWRRPMLAGLLLGALLGAAASAALAPQGIAITLGSEERARPARERPPEPLPREWRWSPRGVRYEHMFRQSAPERR